MVRLLTTLRSLLHNLPLPTRDILVPGLKRVNRHNGFIQQLAMVDNSYDTNPKGDNSSLQSCKLNT